MHALVIFAANCERTASFYAALLGGSPTGDDTFFTVHSDSAEVHVLRIPPEFLTGELASVPPLPRADVALKPSFEVASLPQALARVEQHGGVSTDRRFSDENYEYVDVIDNEGNVIQLRSSRS